MFTRETLMSNIFIIWVTGSPCIIYVEYVCISSMSFLGGKRWELLTLLEYMFWLLVSILEFVLFIFLTLLCCACGCCCSCFWFFVIVMSFVCAKCWQCILIARRFSLTCICLDIKTFYVEQKSYAFGNTFQAQHI